MANTINQLSWGDGGLVIFEVLLTFKVNLYATIRVLETNAYVNEVLALSINTLCF